MAKKAKTTNKKTKARKSTQAAPTNAQPPSGETQIPPKSGDSERPRASSPESGELVSGPELARRLDLTARTIRALALEGVAIRVGRARYDLEASTINYIRYLKTRAPVRGSERYTEEVRLKRAQRELREIELGKARGELVPLELVAQSTLAVYTIHSEELHALEVRILPYLQRGKYSRETLRNEIDRLRTRLARGLERYCGRLEGSAPRRKAKAKKKRGRVGKRKPSVTPRKRGARAVSE